MIDITVVFVVVTSLFFSVGNNEWWILVHGYWWRWPLTVVSIGAVFVVLFISESDLFPRRKMCKRCGFEEDSRDFAWLIRGQKKEQMCNYCLSMFALKSPPEYIPKKEGG